jgi:hypothetical protein
MIAVALVTIFLSMAVWTRRRSDRLSAEADRHLAVWRKFIASGGPSPDQAEYHRKLAVKYAEVAACPWLSVEPDPPPPK